MQIPPPGGWVVKLLADNSIALGLMSHASFFRRDTIEIIARSYAALLTFTAPCSFFVVTDHIVVVFNIATDDLSCPIQYPRWSSVHLISPEIKSLTVNHISSELLLHLLCIVSSPQTGDLLESAKSKLISSALCSLSIGAQSMDFSTLLSSTPRERKLVKSSRSLCQR